MKTKIHDYKCTCDICGKTFTSDSPIQELCLTCIKEYSDFLSDDFVVIKKDRAKNYFAELTDFLNK